MHLFTRSSADTYVGMATSQLFDQEKFYDAFSDDLRRAKQRVVIESPFITIRRLNALLPTLQKLRRQDVRIIINTKPLEEHEPLLFGQALQAIALLQEMGVTVLMTVGHHRKLAIIDDDILWEGSLNILSQNDSCEFMRRMQSPILVQQMVCFTGANKWA
jgi:phosphatidylserine/phosphatidylglycerophosphate/cardiolipin synthase-like enzyme